MPYFVHIMSRQDLLEKSNDGKNRRQQERGDLWIVSIKEVIGLSLQGLSISVGDRTLCVLLIHRVARNQSQLNRM